MLKTAHTNRARTTQVRLETHLDKEKKKLASGPGCVIECLVAENAITEKVVMKGRY